ncbi:hypothetical protein QR680_007010 [Steinernema hermaphroditum]|uniref:Xaa-Pro dipeptidase n=1 Tax=Steinernema hermaphroditum TaxID=289476 RepID=A0AA39LXG0_9BILA|nr:hypothetical protein QR680_007010 [Steinernema hermaphroditum]
MSFDLGGNTHHVPAKLFVDNRRRLVAELQKLPPKAGTFVVLQGGVGRHRYNTDSEDLPFRQESYFFWAFGAHESDAFGVIDVATGKSVFFPPRLPPDFAIWEGKIRDEAWLKAKYEVDEVIFNDKYAINDYLTSHGAKNLYLLKAENTDSGNTLVPASFPKRDHFNPSIDTATLYPVIANLRVFKTDLELDVLRYAVKIACEAHKDVMKSIRPNMFEYQCESLFRHHSYYHGGCRHLAYTCVAATGCNSSILHYGHANAPNSKLIKDGDMCMYDMGPEYNCYASDVTCSFPANGKFTENQKLVYNAVLKANREVFKAAKPGVRWIDMHLLAEKVLLEGLKGAGILKGDVDAMVKARIGAVFLPHGLGHLMGLDVHDVGGFLGDAVPRPSEAGLSSLRTTRTLQERMCITIEPGCYFIDILLDRALADPKQKDFFIVERLNEFRGFGGIRIEDDIVVWEKGNENMSQNLPRTVEEIEEFMKH